MSIPTQWYVRTKTGASGPYTTQQIKDFANNGKLPRQASISKTQDGPWTTAENAKGLFPDRSNTDDPTGQSDEDPMRASDYVPNVVKHSAAALASAASSIASSIVKKGKKSDTLRKAYAKAEEWALEPATEKPDIAQNSLKPDPNTFNPSIGTSISPPEPIRTVKSQLVGIRKCPFCTAEVSEDAIKCRYCSEFLDGRDSQLQQIAAIAATMQSVNAPAPVARWNPGVAAVLSFFLPGLGQIYKGQIFNGLLWMIVVFVGYALLVVPGLVLHLCCVIGARMGDPYK
jgi:TM2 domain-containing membrane protein YozV